ncbi:MAG: hypothetical protein E3J50_00665 [Dehalococcoidia bacterium]|nr:MAG: hypothetical protein E3J50_00665 [Dehalococcoidia bacterium]
MWITNREAEARAYQRRGLFLKDLRAYWEEVRGLQGTGGAFYEEIGKAQPNPGYCALTELEAPGILKRVITQNIDGFHRTAGSPEDSRVSGQHPYTEMPILWLRACQGRSLYR